MTEYQKKLQDLRAILTADGLDGLIVPRADKYQSKYPTDHDERLKFLTGFSGSAGYAVVLRDKAVAMTDPRYSITIREEVDPALYDYADTNDISAIEWAVRNMKKGQRLGFDPDLHTAAEAERMAAVCAKAGLALVPTKGNPVDRIWTTQPAEPCEKAFVLDLKYAGQDSTAKRVEIAKELQEAGANRFVIAATDAICWLLNIRGNDTRHSPTVQCLAIVDAKDGSVDLFIDDAKLDAATRAHIGPDVRIRKPADFDSVLDGFVKSGDVIGLDPNRAAQSFKLKITEGQGKLKEMRDPCILKKAMKNKVEQENLRVSHRRDSIAWVKFMHWMSQNLPTPAGGNPVTEMDASDVLDTFRREDPMFHQHGYGPIAGWAKNGANIHYHSEGRGDVITTDNFLLLDSGAQSKDGQTDITRAIAVGQVSAEMKRRYTLVLKGHINLARAVFPKGTTGSQIDALARAPLWADGLNFAHGTGHGVGFYLDVHEGPANINSRSTEPLREGMFLSNEPGYYKEGHYGIRLENEVLVQKWQAPDGKTAEHDMYCFETVSLVPFDRNAIDASVMEPEELAWLNAYHARIYHELSPALSGAQKEWLRLATAAIPHPNLVRQPPVPTFKP